MPIPTPALTMSTTLADDPRNNLPEWYLELRTKARNLCSAHDAASALGLVAQDRDWQQFPGVLTNPVDVAAGQPAVYPLTLTLTLILILTLPRSTHLRLSR
jgi:hypothetical protein